MSSQLQLRIIQRSPTTISTVYGDEDLVWDINLLNNTSHRNNEFDIFEQINLYWQTKPQAFQEAVFKLYKRAYEIFQVGGTIDHLTFELGPTIKELSKLHNPEELAIWGQVAGGLFISPALLRTYGVASGAERFVPAGTRNMTYLREDYIKLLGLAMAIRAFIPIFGEFALHTATAAGTNFKEQRVGKLLEGTSLEESEAYEKLRIYVNEVIQTDKQKASPVLGGLSSEEFPTWILYMIIVRRLTVGNLKGDPSQPNSHLVTYIHFYLKQRLLGYENVFPAGKVRNKDVGSSSADEESKLSILETYKTPSEHSPGDYELMTFYAEQADWAVEVLCPDLDRTIYAQAVEASQFMLGPVPFYQAQAIIVQNLIGPYQAPDVLEHLRRIPSLVLYQIVQAMLWQHGYRDLATFLTTTIKVHDGSLMGTSHAARMNIPREMADRIKDLYPNLKRTSSRSANAKIEPTPMITIKNLVEMMGAQEWVMNIHPEWLKELDTSKVSASRMREWRVPADIRIQLAKLFIQIGMYENPFHTDSLRDFAKLEL